MVKEVQVEKIVEVVATATPSAIPTATPSPTPMLTSSESEGFWNRAKVGEDGEPCVSSAHLGQLMGN